MFIEDSLHIVQAARLREVQEYISSLPIWNVWIPSTRKGDTGIGKTFEDVIGIVENNLQDADFKGVEFKSKRAESGALITLFTKNPCSPVRAVHSLVDGYGYDEDEYGSKRFNTNFANGRRTLLGGKYLTIAQSSNTVDLTADGEICASWQNSVLGAILTKKLGNLALIDADSQEINGVEHFKLKSCCFYWNISVDSFLSLIKSSALSVHFRVKGNKLKARNRGCAFRLEKASLNLLYSNRLVIGA